MPRRNVATDVFKFIDMSGGDNACWPWTRKIKAKKGVKPRPYFDLDGEKVLAYRLVKQLVHGKELPNGLPDDKMACHSCDNSICCNPAHIYAGDHEQNMDDMATRGTHGLTPAVVRAIRKLRQQGKTQQEIADTYGISREAVSAIDTGRNRSKLKDAEDDKS